MPLILGSILILALAYFCVFRPAMSKADELKEKNKLLEGYVKELDMKIAHEKEKQAEIITYNNDREALLKRFFGGMTHEKANHIFYEMMEETGMDFSQVSYSVNTMYFNQEEAMASNLIEREKFASDSTIAVAGTPEQTYDPLMGYKTSLSVEFSCTDQQLTDMIDFINEYEEKLALESITVGYDETTGNLTGTYVLCMYAASGIDKQYEEPKTDDVKLGVANIFGAKKVSGTKKK